MDSYTDRGIDKNRDGKMDRFKKRICIAIVKDRDSRMEN